MALMRNNLLLIICKEPQFCAAKLAFFRYAQNNLLKIRYK